MNALGKVGVLYGGVSAERPVSIMSGEGVYQALLEKGVDAHLFDLGERTLGELQEQGFDRVFIVLHGRYGEDGCVQGALEIMGIPYTGPGVMASSVAMNKIMTKRLFLEQGIPTPDYYPVKTFEDLQHAYEKLGLPMILKPAHEGSTLGLSKITDKDQLEHAFQEGQKYEAELLAEQFIEGRELTIAVLGETSQAKALPIIEIIAPDGNYDFENKYISNDTQYICPADLPEALSAQIKKYSEQAYKAVRCEGWSRVDVMLDAQNNPYVLEINTAPGMTSHSLVPMAAKAEGVDYAELCLAILKSARCKLQKPDTK